MSSESEHPLQAEIARLRARVADLERAADERMQAEYALGREREASGRRIQAESRMRAGQQAAVAELGQLALAGANLTMVLDHAVRLVAQTLGVELCQIQELMPDHTFVIRAGVGWKPGTLGRSFPTSPLESQAGYTLLSNEPIVVEDLQIERRFRAPALLIAHGVLSGVTVLVRGRDKPLAVLGVHSPRQHTFSPSDVNFVQGVANVLAAAIERKQDEDALRRSEAKARAFLESAAEGIVVVDRDGQIVLVNARTETMFGYSRGELLGQTLELLLPEGVRGVHARHRVSYFAEPRARQMGRDLILAGRRRDGTQFPVEISLSSAETTDGVLALAFITDISERVSLQRAARQAEKLAALGTLAAGIAHEINNPLGVISSRIEIMLMEAQADPLPPSVVDDLVTVRRHAERVGRIAQGLLAFSRPSTSERSLVDVNRAIEDTLVLAHPQVAKAGIAIRTALGSGLAQIHGNPHALSQVLMNLLTNARDAMPEGGEIRIETTGDAEDPQWILVSVSDTGRGMDTDTLARIFDPFYTTKPTGTGLGLSISYGIVRDHGGTIGAESTEGQGTTFLIRLPVAPSDPAA